MYGMLQWGCTWYALFFAVGLHNARGTPGLHLVRLHNIHNASGSSYAQPQHNKARLDRDACVLRAGAVQNYARPRP